MRYAPIKEVMEIIYKKVTTDDWDEVLCIVGPNRRGKSNLALHFADWWIKKRYGEVKEDDTDKHIGLDLYSFAKIYGAVKKFDVAVHDEAGDISNRGAMTKQNKLYAQAYQITAGENLMTILCLPELWDLDTYFRKHRIRHLIHVYARGKGNFWTNKRYKRMVGINSSMPFKNYYLTTPSFTFTFPKYNGPLKKRYDELKAEKMKNSREDISKMIVDLKTKNSTDKVLLVKKMRKSGKTFKEISEELGVSIHTARTYNSTSV